MDPLTLLIGASVNGYKYATGMSTKPVTVNNNSAKSIYLAICFSPDNAHKSWVTVGWLNVPARSSDTFQVPSMRVGSPIYLYARTKGKKLVWGGDNVPIGVAEPTYGKLQDNHRFIVYEPKGSPALLQESSRSARVSMVKGYKLDLGIMGGEWSLRG